MLMYVGVLLAPNRTRTCQVNGFSSKPAFVKIPEPSVYVNSGDAGVSQTSRHTLERSSPFATSTIRVS